jgi:hypothetical protein
MIILAGMKTLNLLPIALVLTTLLQSCSAHKVNLVVEEKVVIENSVYNIFPVAGYTNFSSESRYSLMPRYQNFQKKQNPKQSFIIANMIAVVQPELTEERRDQIATMLAGISKRYNIKPEIFVAIIDTESNFNAEMVSSTGDLSIAQINVDMWNKEFQRMNLPLIDKERVRADLEYSFTFMAEILNILKLRFETSDPQWFARYHSSTPKYKADYFSKLSFRLDLMARSESLRNQIAQIQNIELLAPPVLSDRNTATLLASNYVQSILTPEPIASSEKLYTPVAAPENVSLKYATSVDLETSETTRL